MLDKNNDNWGSLRLIITDSSSTYTSYAPSCDSNPSYAKYCFDLGPERENDYALLMVHGYQPTWYDEVFWQVLNPFDGRVYSGNYDTVMKFVVGRVEAGSTSFGIQLSEDESSKLEPNKPVCESLTIDNGNGDGSMCTNKKPRPPAPKAAVKGTDEELSAISEIESASGGASKRLAERSKSGDFVDSKQSSKELAVKGGEVRDVVSATSAPVQSPKPRPKVRMLGSGTDLQMEKHNGTWHTADGIAATWAIANEDGYFYYYLGSYCSSGFADDDGLCVDLTPGCYTFKVTGFFATSKEAIKWDYCGVKGGVMSELPFCIDENYKCKPKIVVKSKCISVDSDVYTMQAEEVTISGSFDLGGMDHADLSEDDQKIVQSAMGQELTDISGSSGGMQMTLQFSPAPTAVPFPGPLKRGLTSTGDVATTRFTFSVRLSTATLNHGSLKAYLSRSMSSGLFAARVAHMAHMSSTRNMETVNLAHLVELTVVHEMEVNEQVSGVASAVVMIGVVIGFVFSLLLFRQTQNTQNPYRHELVPVEVN